MAIVNQIKQTLRKLIPSSLIGAYHYLLAGSGAIYYGFPSKKIKVIGVTGTNGKSSTVELLGAILKEAGFKVALSSSIKWEIAGEVRKNGRGNSMPGRFALQGLLANAVAQKCDYAVIEVTSEGIKQFRHKFINFRGAVLTNLTPEHIEAHGSFENYRQAKLELFKVAKEYHIINRDDENSKYFWEIKAKKKYNYGKCAAKDNLGIKQNADNFDICAREIVLNKKGSCFKVLGEKIVLNLLGEFNIYNALAAIGVALAEGIDLKICQRALIKIKFIPGRMEKVWENPKVLVDYAFTPNALEQVYRTLQQELMPDGKLICLLGACGGGRDKWKRPVLGQIAAKYCDRIVLTDEDPYDEDPQKIINMIKEGVIKEGFPMQNLVEIHNRRQAITKVLAEAEAQDVVILTGKGSENAIRYEKGKIIEWDEKTVVKEELSRLGKKY